MIARMNLAIFLIITSVEAAVVFSNHGRIHIEGHKSCMITNNGVQQNMTEGVSTNYIFGMVYYQCGNEFGYLISKMSCMECGIYCTSNDIIEGCQNKVLQIAIGIIVGLVISGILYLIIHFSVVKFVERAYHYVISMLQKRSDKKQNKHAERINKLTAMYAEPSYKNKFNHVRFKKNAYSKRKDTTSNYESRMWNSSQRNDEQYENELKVMNYQSTNYPNMYKNENENDECKVNIEDKGESSKVPMRDTNKVINKSKSNRGSNGSNAEAVLVAALLASTISNVSTCDMNFYFQSEGSICDETNCYDIKMYTFPLTYGQSVCFRDTEGQVTSFTIVNSYERARYNRIYSVSDASLQYDSTFSCESKATCKVGSCRIDSIHPSFANHTGFNHFGCMTTASECDSYCFWKGKCVYYHWWIESVGSIYDVYEMTSKVWEIKVSIKDKDGVKHAILNVNNPSVNMMLENAASIVKVPMIITNVNYETNTDLGRGVIIEDKMYQVMIADSNNPVQGMVGDFQIEMNDRSKVIIDPNNVICQVDNCKVICVMSKPAITRVVNNRLKYRNDKIYRMNNDRNIVETRKSIQPTIMMSVGNFQFKNLLVKPTKCDINVDMTFGCVGCGEKPYIVTSSSNIEVEGLVEFESNCTFDRAYMSCSTEPYVLYLDDNYKNCRIDIKRMDKILNVTIDYSYAGTLSPIKTMVGTESFLRVTTSILTSKSFVQSTMNTVTTCTIIGTAVAITTRLIRAYFATRIGKSTNDG